MRWIVAIEMKRVSADVGVLGGKRAPVGNRLARQSARVCQNVYQGAYNLKGLMKLSRIRCHPSWAWLYPESFSECWYLLHQRCISTSVEPENTYLLSGAYCAYSGPGESAHSICITPPIRLKICTVMRTCVRYAPVKCRPKPLWWRRAIENPRL